MEHSLVYKFLQQLTSTRDSMILPTCPGAYLWTTLHLDHLWKSSCLWMWKSSQQHV